MKNRKKITAALLSIFLLLAGCSGNSPSSEREAYEPSGSWLGASEEVQTPQAKEVVKIMLPNDHAAVGEVLLKVADAQNVELQVRTGQNEPQYTAELAEALAGEEPPDLYWLPGEGAARALEAAGYPPFDLSSDGGALGAAARMVPEMSRILDFDKTYGLPLGSYAQGTLVNLPVLASLLGTEDLATLQRDLAQSSFTEWRAMVLALEEYLETPSRYQFTLAGHTYTMPRYRPEESSSLRGIFAMPTADGSAYAQNSLSTLYAAGFMDPADFLDTDPAVVGQIIQQPLDALYGAIEFETQHLTAEEGPLARGDEGMQQAQLTAKKAKQLFEQGIALFWKGDSRDGLKMEQDNPGMYGNLFLIPTKLPFETAGIEIINTLYGIGTDGYLCLASEEVASGAAGRLLVQLYTDPAFQAEVENSLYLLPYTDLYPGVPLLAKLEEAMGLGEIYILPLDQSELATVQAQIGEFVRENLMEKAEWTEEDKANFLTVAQGLLGAAGTSMGMPVATEE